MSKGQVKEFDSPYNLLGNENSLLTKMVEKTGPSASKKLRQMAADAHMSGTKLIRSYLWSQGAEQLHLLFLYYLLYRVAKKRKKNIWNYLWPQSAEQLHPLFLIILIIIFLCKKSKITC